MTISIPTRKNLLARRIADERPDLKPSEVAKLAGTNAGVVVKAIKQDHFGRQKPKSRK